jgi:N-acetylglucosamine-6-sulfatase
MRATSLRQTRSRIAIASLLAAASLAIAAAVPERAMAPRGDRLNVVVILTDDQSFDTLPTSPAAMPWLQSQIQARSGHWLWFPNAVISTPLCCPSRASILSGRYSHHTHVRNNDQGERFDDSNTLATWLHDAGYFTGLFGKYLNRYPFGRGPYDPPGWDRWVAKRNTAATTTYYDYGFVDQGIPLQVRDASASYATDLFAGRALEFLRTAPVNQPYFLYYAPSAPHPPWTPPRRHLGAFAELTIARSRSVGERDVSDKPAWVQALPLLDGHDRAELVRDQRREREALLGVDDEIHRLVDAIAARGDLDRTAIFFLTDNGYSFGEHRIRGKRCPYEECIRTPFAVRMPGRQARDVAGVVSNVDLAPTIADLTGVRPGLSVDGTSFAEALLGGAWHPPDGALIEWAGDRTVPPWQGVRTTDFAYIEDADGTVELYDLTGVLGRADPLELRNRAGDARYRSEVRRLSALLRRLRSGDLSRG